MPMASSSSGQLQPPASPPPPLLTLESLAEWVQSTFKAAEAHYSTLESSVQEIVLSSEACSSQTDLALQEIRDLLRGVLSPPSRDLPTNIQPTVDRQLVR
ncbi:hypothetical protein CVT24_003192 [Panaeolus cyanescens]|uniref:Uncharacterized protein n=1 Tax=Panaeolus cyanescens TaxID=181874 RepID=A0A409YXJ7_9AGAR|nr:hypothetical protein CVT24_003192 [Panaeolus cyanescens]